MSKQDELVFLPLGGVGEIGMNLALYGYSSPAHRQWIMVDCGVTFPGLDLPGVDLVLPDIRFLAEERKNLKGIIITHAHEDHYGALADLWPGLNVPVYASPFTAGMLEAKRSYERSRAEVPITIFKEGDRINVGPFEIEAVGVNHSIPEPMSLVIRTPLGNIVHTGDWKIDHAPSLGPFTDEARFPCRWRRGRSGADVRQHQCHARWRLAFGRGGLHQPHQDHRGCQGPCGDHHVLVQCRPHPLDCQGIGCCRSRSAAARQFDEACLRRRPRCRSDGRAEPVHRRRRIRLYPARQGRGDPDR
ncbi:ribonuclease J [Rhizobium sp. RCAM05350]|nr:ribonuclease J [Rhizobium sp. RCAM05350]